MQREKFKALVTKAVESLPPEFQCKLENVDVVVEDWPTREQLKRARCSRPDQLLGLYEGVPRIKRSRAYSMVLPDKISIFQKPIEAQCHCEHEIEARIEQVVRHEIAHHFGIDEQTLRQIGSQGRPKR